MKRFLLLLAVTGSAFAQAPIEIPVEVVRAGTETPFPVTFGVPLPESLEVTDGSELTLRGAAGSQVTTLARWPSGHVQWVLVDARVPRDASLALTRAAEAPDMSAMGGETRSPGELEVSHGGTKTRLKKPGLTLTRNGKTWTTAEHYETGAFFELNGPERCVVAIHGAPKESVKADLPRFTLRFEFLREEAEPRRTLTLRLPGRAVEVTVPGSTPVTVDGPPAERRLDERGPPALARVADVTWYDRSLALWHDVGPSGRSATDDTSGSVDGIRRLLHDFLGEQALGQAAAAWDAADTAARSRMGETAFYLTGPEARRDVAGLILHGWLTGDPETSTAWKGLVERSKAWLFTPPTTIAAAGVIEHLVDASRLTFTGKGFQRAWQIVEATVASARNDPDPAARAEYARACTHLLRHAEPDARRRDLLFDAIEEIGTTLGDAATLAPDVVRTAAYVAGRRDIADPGWKMWGDLPLEARRRPDGAWELTWTIPPSGAEAIRIKAWRERERHPFHSARDLPGEPAPAAANQRQTWVVTGLAPDSPWRFGARALRVVNYESINHGVPHRSSKRGWWWLGVVACVVAAIALLRRR